MTPAGWLLGRLYHEKEPLDDLDSPMGYLHMLVFVQERARRVNEIMAMTTMLSGAVQGNTEAMEAGRAALVKALLPFSEDQSLAADETARKVMDDWVGQKAVAVHPISFKRREATLSPRSGMADGALGRTHIRWKRQVK